MFDEKLVNNLKRIFDNLNEYCSLDISSHLYENKIRSYTKDEISYKKGEYPFIPHRVDESFNYIKESIRLFKQLNNKNPKTFLDLGCGIGNILEIAKLNGLESTGVELNETLINLGKQIRPEVNIIHDDILKWIPKQKYDIVWFYKPLCDHMLWNKFLLRFYKRFPNDQIFICSLDGNELVNKKKSKVIYVNDSYNENIIYQLTKQIL